MWQPSILAFNEIVSYYPIREWAPPNVYRNKKICMYETILTLLMHSGCFLEFYSNYIQIIPGKKLHIYEVHTKRFEKNYTKMFEGSEMY